MKNKINLLIIVLLVSVFIACKKEGAKPAPVVTPVTPLTTPQLFVGKWYVTKDSVQTLDNNTQIPNLLQSSAYTNGDFVVFNKDSTATVSSLAAYTAFLTDYGATNVDSKLFITPPVNPALNFKYKVFAEFTTQSLSAADTAKTVYALSMQNTNAFIAAGYNIVAVSPTTLVLNHVTQIPVLLHYYIINEYIYLKK